MAILERKGVYAETFTGTSGTIWQGQRWIIFTNLHASENATIVSKNADATETYGTFVIPAGDSLNFGERTDGNEYARFDVNASSSSVQAILEKKNNQNT